MIIMLTMTRLDDDDSGGSIPSILHDKWENMQRIKFWALLLRSSFPLGQSVAVDRHTMRDLQ